MYKNILTITLLVVLQLVVSIDSFSQCTESATRILEKDTLTWDDCVQLNEHKLIYCRTSDCDYNSTFSLKNVNINALVVRNDTGVYILGFSCINESCIYCKASIYDCEEVENSEFIIQFEDREVAEEFREYIVNYQKQYLQG